MRPTQRLGCAESAPRYARGTGCSVDSAGDIRFFTKLHATAEHPERAVLIRGILGTRPPQNRWTKTPVLYPRPKARRNSSSMCSRRRLLGLQSMTPLAKRKNRERPKISTHNLRKNEPPGTSHDRCGFPHRYALGRGGQSGPRPHRICVGGNFHRLIACLSRCGWRVWNAGASLCGIIETICCTCTGFSLRARKSTSGKLMPRSWRKQPSCATKFGLKTPDAIHLATAILAGAAASRLTRTSVLASLASAGRASGFRSSQTIWPRDFRKRSFFKPIPSCSRGIVGPRWRSPRKWRP